MLRPCVRSNMGEIDQSVVDARKAGRPQLTNSLDTVVGFAVAAVLPCDAEMCISLPWSSRVVATDAAPGGHGEAYALLPIPTVHEWASVVCHRREKMNPLNPPRHKD